MSDDNKINEELLEEVKKLRQLEEDKKKKKELTKGQEVFLIGCGAIIIVPMLIGIILFMENFEGW
jgi:hypothetical protein